MSDPREPSKEERLAEFIQRMRGAAPTNSERASYELVVTTLNGVEDELTSIPNNPAAWRTDGRLYPPQPDARRSVRAHIVRYRSRKHNTFIGDNGAIEIRDERDGVILSKPGADGREVRDL